MKKLIHFEDGRGRLHCDNPRCDCILPEGEVEWGEHLVGYPCPECGADMLTRSDYEDSERLHRAVNWINRWFGWLGTERDDPRNTAITARTHNGRVIVTPPEPRYIKPSEREPDGY